MVKRIDEGLGLVLEVPSEPTTSPGFVHISNTADTTVDKLQQVRHCTEVSTIKLSANRCEVTALTRHLPSSSRAERCSHNEMCHT